MTTTTSQAAYDQIAAVAREQAATDGVTFEQAFAEALRTRRDLRIALAKEQATARTPERDPVRELVETFVAGLVAQFQADDPKLSPERAYAKALDHLSPEMRAALIHGADGFAR